MGSHEEAVASIDALDNKFVWEGMESPMVAKWMDAALQRRRREQHLAAMRQGLVPSMSMGAWAKGCGVQGLGAGFRGQRSVAVGRSNSGVFCMRLVGARGKERI